MAEILSRLISILLVMIMKRTILLTKLRPHKSAKTKFTAAKTFTFQKKNKIL